MEGSTRILIHREGGRERELSVWPFRRRLERTLSGRRKGRVLREKIAIRPLGKEKVCFLEKTQLIRKGR